MKEMRKKAASTMETNLTQKLSLSRFIIISGYPPRSSGAETIVYHVTPNDRSHYSPTGRSLQNTPLGISVLPRGLDHREVGPLPRLERPRLALDAERARSPERRERHAGRTAHTVQLHREERLLEEVHARAAPEPVCTHPDPDAPLDHTWHGRDAAREEVVRTGTVRRRDAGLRENVQILLRDAGRQVRGYRLWGEELYALGVANRRDANPSPLVAAEDVSEAALTVPDELDLLGALGEVDRKPPPHLPRATRRQT